MKMNKQQVAVKVLKDLVKSGRNINEISKWDIFEGAEKNYGMKVDLTVAHNVVGYVRMFLN